MACVIETRAKQWNQRNYFWIQKLKLIRLASTNKSIGFIHRKDNIFNMEVIQTNGIVYLETKVKHFYVCHMYYSIAALVLLFIGRAMELYHCMQIQELNRYDLNLMFGLILDTSHAIERNKGLGYYYSKIVQYTG